MKWEVLIIPKASGIERKTLVLDADNWMDALKSGFDYMGKSRHEMKIVSCQIAEDNTVCINDFSTKSVYYIKPADASFALPPLPEPAGESFLESKRAVSLETPAAVSFMKEIRELPPSPPPVPEHRVFYQKDEDPGPLSNIVYRERIISVPPETSKEDVTMLMKYYFESLRREMGRVKGDRYINLAVYDHEFKGNPMGLSLAAISWQEWKNKEPTIVYPREEAVAAASMPPARAAAPSRPIPRFPQQQAPAGARPSFPSTQAPAQDIMRTSGLPIGADEFDANKVLGEVFDELQDMFFTQTQDDAAEFVLNLAMKKIPAEAGTIFLADINTRDLMFSAVRGPMAEKLKGNKLMMTRGIVGFAAREGAVMAVADVQKDPRFCSDFDQSGDFSTKSVLCAPVQYEGRTFGAVELVNKRGGDMFTQEDINVVSYLALQLAEFIATSLPSPEPDFMEEGPRKAAMSKRPARIRKAKSKKPPR